LFFGLWSDPDPEFAEYFDQVDEIQAGRDSRKTGVGRNHVAISGVRKRNRARSSTWVDFAKNFRKRFRNEAGLPKTRQTFRTTRRASRPSVKAF